MEVEVLNCSLVAINKRGLNARISFNTLSRISGALSGDFGHKKAFLSLNYKTRKGPRKVVSVKTFGLNMV